MKQFLILITTVFMLSSCVCPSAIEVDSVQRNDKKLTCKDVVMEINEAEFFRKEAQQKQYRRVEYMLNPLCYPSGYLSGSKGMRAADSRLDYLNNIYELLGCGQDIKNVKPKPNPLPPQSNIAPQMFPQGGVPFTQGYPYPYGNPQYPANYAPYSYPQYGQPPQHARPVPFKGGTNLVKKTTIPQMGNKTKVAAPVALQQKKQNKRKTSNYANKTAIMFRPVPVRKPVEDPEFKKLSLQRTKEKMDGISLPFKVIPYQSETKQDKTPKSAPPLFSEKVEECVPYQGCLGAL
ncbi:MAG: hypothetical protein MK137_00610 [Rickettsiales bacterium]|nr:hypothetical protein [Rickettsiales bacterium]